MSRLLSAIAAGALLLSGALAGTPVLAASGTGPAPAAAAAVDGSTITWSLVPAGADGPDGRISSRHELDPGGSVVDYVTVTNFSASTESFDVYASDGVVTDGGDFDLLSAGEEPVDGGSWIRIGAPADQQAEWAARRTIELGPEQSATLPISIDVPEQAAPGDHPAGVVAQLVRDDAAVQMATRVGVRAHLRVSGESIGALTATGVHATWSPSWNPFAPGTMTVDYEVRNTGNVRVQASPQVQVTGPLGIAGTSADAAAREILPGQSARFSSTLSVWPLGYSSGVVSVQPSVVGQDVPPDSLTGGSAEFSAWTPPWSALILLVLLVAGVFGIRWQRRRSAARMQARIDRAVADRERVLAGPPPTGS